MNRYLLSPSPAQRAATVFLVLAIVLGAGAPAAGAWPDHGADPTVTGPATTPAATGGVWLPTGPMSGPRKGHTATLLPDGRVLAMGAGGNATDDPAEGLIEAYDAGTGTWAPLISARPPRRYHCATLLPDGTVLMIGGDGGPGEDLHATGLTFDPRTGQLGPTAPMRWPRRRHTATLLPDGTVLVVGGDGPSYLDAIERYDPQADEWTPAGTLTTARTYHTATLLPDGRVLVVGGAGAAGRLSSIEVINQATGISTVVANLITPRAFHTATLLPDGRVLIAGGDGGGGDGFPRRAEIFNPADNTVREVAAMAWPRRYHTATLLPDGTVLMVGGDKDGPLDTVERYDPADDTWSPVASLAWPRRWHTATLLPDGRVLVAGGEGAEGVLDSAEILNLAPPSCVQPPEDLLAWWPMDLAPGAQTHDRASGYTGAVTGAIQTEGQVGAALRFDGSDDFVEVKHAPGLDIGDENSYEGGDFSIDAWVRLEPDAQGVRTILDKRTLNPIRGYALFTIDGHLALQLADGTAGLTCGSDPAISPCTNYNSALAIDDGEWHFVAVTVDRDGQGRFYVDDQTATFDPGARRGSLANDAPLYIGRHAGGDRHWKGALDEVELIRRALSPDEVAGLRRAGPAGKCLQGGPGASNWKRPCCLPGVWEPGPTTGPTERAEFVYAMDETRGVAVLFGGRNASGTLGDTWEWYGDSGVGWWQRQSAITPPARYGASMAYHEPSRRVVLFGGQGADGLLGDTWTWDGASWIQVASSGPPVRHGAALAYAADRQRLVLFGGQGSTGYLSDVWEWDGQSWSQRNAPSGPTARAGAAATFEAGAGAVLVFGGRGSGGVLADAWRWNGATWQPLNGPTPPARDLAVLAARPGCGQLVLHGGQGAGGGELGDTWQWNGQAWQAVGTGGPGPRAGHGLLADPVHRRLLLFGGRAGREWYDDFWDWRCPCDDEVADLDANGEPVLPPNLDPDTPVQIEEVTEENGPVADLYHGHDTSTDTWYADNPCESSIGGTLPDEVRDFDLSAELAEAGIEGVTPEEILAAYDQWEAEIEEIVRAEPDGLASAPPAAGNYVAPAVPPCRPPGKYVFGGRDIVFVHGLKLEHIYQRALGKIANDADWRPPTQFPGKLENPAYYGSGYYKKIAEDTWREHIDRFLKAQGIQNRYLIVARPDNQRLEAGAQAMLTQIADAMVYGEGVVDPSGLIGTQGFGSPSYVVVAHSTGGLAVDVAMWAAEYRPNLNARFIPRHAKAMVALDSAFAGSRYATAAVAVGMPVSAIAAAGAWVCPLVKQSLDALGAGDPVPDFECLDADILMKSIAGSVLVDLVPTVAQEKWSTAVAGTPVRTLLINGGHPSYFRPLKHLLLPGFDDGVLNINSQVANPNFALFWPSGFRPQWSPINVKVYDMGLRKADQKHRARGYYIDQVSEPRLNLPGVLLHPFRVAGATTPFVSPTGMVQPVAAQYRLDGGFNPLRRHPNHFSYLLAATDHFSKYSGSFKTSIQGNDYHPTSGDERNYEETRVIADRAVFDPYLMPYGAADGQPLLRPSDVPGLRETVIGRSIGPIVVTIFGRKVTLAKRRWIWKRTYHRLEGHDSKVVMDYVYESVLKEQVFPCDDPNQPRPDPVPRYGAAYEAQAAEATGMHRTALDLVLDGRASRLHAMNVGSGSAIMILQLRATPDGPVLPCNMVSACHVVVAPNAMHTWNLEDGGILGGTISVPWTGLAEILADQPVAAIVEEAPRSPGGGDLALWPSGDVDDPGNTAVFPLLPSNHLADTDRLGTAVVKGWNTANNPTSMSGIARNLVGTLELLTSIAVPGQSVHTFQPQAAPPSTWSLSLSSQPPIPFYSRVNWQAPGGLNAETAAMIGSDLWLPWVQKRVDGRCTVVSIHNVMDAESLVQLQFIQGATSVLLRNLPAQWGPTLIDVCDNPEYGAVPDGFDGALRVRVLQGGPLAASAVTHVAGQGAVAGYNAMGQGAGTADVLYAPLINADVPLFTGTGWPLRRSLIALANPQPGAIVAQATYHGSNAVCAGQSFDQGPLTIPGLRAARLDPQAVLPAGCRASAKIGATGGNVAAVVIEEGFDRGSATRPPDGPSPTPTTTPTLDPDPSARTPTVTPSPQSTATPTQRHGTDSTIYLPSLQQNRP